MAEKTHHLQAAAPTSALARYTSVLPSDPAEMVHELASPFSAITMQLENLEEEIRCCDQCQTYIPEQLHPTLTQLRSVHQLMQTYLHEQVTVVAECNVQQIVCSVLLLLQPIALQERVLLQYMRKNAVWWPTKPYQVRQILLNVLNNSLEAYSRQPTLTRREIVIKTKIRKNRLELQILDWAGGMPASTKKPSGHGIGIAQVQKYIVQLGGTLEIRSVNSRGTDVRIFVEKAQ